MPSEVNGVVSVDCRVVISDGLYKCITPLHRGVLRVLAFFIFARRVSRKSAFAGLGGLRPGPRAGLFPMSSFYSIRPARPSNDKSSKS